MLTSSPTRNETKRASKSEKSPSDPFLEKPFKPFGTPPRTIRSVSMNAVEPATPTPAPVKERAKSMTISKRVLFCDPPIQDLGHSQAITPLKSILKLPSISDNRDSQTRTNASLDPSTIISDIYSCSIDFGKYANLDEIFDIAMSILQKNRKQQLEVYAALNSLLRARDSSVSTNTLIKHGNALLKFAYRDLQKAENSNDKLDIRVQIQILKVVDYFMYCEDVAATLNNTFTTKFLTNGLKALENTETYKSVVGAYLHIFNYQRLSHALPNEIATRLLISVSTRPTLSSVGLFSEYIATFRLLIQSHPSIMISHCSDWIPVVLKCLVDENSLLRYQALSVLQDCNQKLLPNHSICSCIRQNFGQSINTAVTEPISCVAEPAEPHKYIDLFHDRMVSLLSIPGEGKTVMNIWSAVLSALSRWGTDPNDRIEKWKHFGQLLSISKHAFNSDQTSSKIAALQSWKVIINMWSVPGQLSASSERRAAFLLHPLLSLSPDSRPLILKHVISSYVHLVNSYLQNAGPNNLQMVKFIWVNLTVPFLTILFGNSTEAAREKGVEIFLQLLAPGSKSPQFSKDSNLDASSLHPISPKFWRLELKSTLEFLAASSKNIAWNDFMQIWERILNVIRIAMKREIQISESTMSQVASCCSFFCDLTEAGMTGEKMTQAVLLMLDRLGMCLFIDGELTETEGVLSSPKTRKATAHNDLSCLPIMFVSKAIFSAVPGSSETKKFGYLSDYLTTVHEQTGPPKRTMSIFSCCLNSIPYENRDIITGAFDVVRDMLKRHARSWNFEALEDEFLSLLITSFQKTSQDFTMMAWNNLSDVILQTPAQYCLFIRRLLSSEPSRDRIAQYVSSITGAPDTSWMANMLNKGIVPIGEMIAYLSADLDWMDGVSDFLSCLNGPFENTFISHELKAVYGHACRELVSKLMDHPDSLPALKTLLPYLYRYQSDAMGLDANVLLKSYESLLIAGFKSADSNVRSITVENWKTLFCENDKIIGPYSKSLVTIVNKQPAGTPKPSNFPSTRARSKLLVLNQTESVDDVIYQSFSEQLPCLTETAASPPIVNEESGKLLPDTVEDFIEVGQSPISDSADEIILPDASAMSPSPLQKNNSSETFPDSVDSSPETDSGERLSEDINTPTSSPLSSNNGSPEPMNEETCGKRKKRKRKVTSTSTTRKKRVVESPATAVEQPSTPIKTASYQTPLTPEFSSPPDQTSASAGKLLYNMLKKFENDFQAGDPFADLTPQEKFESETLLMGVLIKARCSQMAAFDSNGPINDQA